MPDTLPPPAPLPGRAASAADAIPSPVIEAAMQRALRLICEAAPPPSVGRRLWRGIRAHAATRAPEWFTAAVLAAFGASLHGLDVSARPDAFSGLTRWASAPAWSHACLAVGLVHLLALAINGTFPRFRWSPHIRALASLAAIVLWVHIALALHLAGNGGPDLTTYALILALEIYNFGAAMGDTGQSEGRRRCHGR